MKASIYDREQLQSLTPTAIAAYLQAKGWHREPSGYEQAELWTLKINRDEPAEALVPTNGNVRDFALRVSELLSTLEYLEQRSQLEIVRDILYAEADVIRLRRLTEAGDAGVIPLVDGVKLVENAIAVMTAAACSAVSPRKVVPSQRPAEAQDYLQHVKLGQTEQGSFVLTIISPVVPLLTPGSPNLLEFMEDPFPRRVTKTLASALAATRVAISLETVSDRLGAFEGMVENGVSTDLCEAIAGLLEAAGQHGRIGLDVRWAPALPVTTQKGSSLEFTYEEAPVLTQAARVLRESSPQESISIFGVVVHLSREQHSDNGAVTIHGVVEGSLRKFLVPLSAADYEVAIEAHRQKRGVYFLADIAKLGRRYRADNVWGFRMLE
jgi:hypothetical protein